MVNITVFLQTLDRDGDPANGIEITPAVAALFDNVSVDLTGDFWLFYQQPAFRGALLQANNALLFGSHRIVRPPHLAMDHLYRSLGVDPRIFVDTVTRRDNDADGTIDDMSTSEYNPQGLLTRWVDDDDADGNPNEIDSNDYDANGNVTRYEYDRDGTPDSITVFEYDVNNNRRRYEYDADADGDLDNINVYQYNANGWLWSSTV